MQLEFSTILRRVKIIKTSNIYSSYNLSNIHYQDKYIIKNEKEVFKSLIIANLNYFQYKF